MGEEWPPYVAGASRYPSDNFLGRLRNISNQLDPTKLLVTDARLDAALDLLAAHAVDPAALKAAGTTDADLWLAAELKAARVHPDTNEKIFLPLCFACYTPMQVR